MESLGATSIAELQELPAADFVWPTNYGVSNPGYGDGTAPWLCNSEAPGYFIDGQVLEEAPLDTFQKGHDLNGDAFLIGANSQDGITPYYEYTAPIPETAADYTSAMESHWGDYASAVMAQYPVTTMLTSNENSTDASHQYVRADGEYNCNCAICGANTSLATMLVRANATVFHYHFTRGICLFFSFELPTHPHHI